MNCPSYKVPGQLQANIEVTENCALYSRKSGELY